ncbi:enoyl-CoA hydratase-related protein [Heliorestis convoluta]|uniref:short-chain-enoyl-CoA hydratase n=1 Tax=Heliorestis convoluta TaxID=356322 RepID=A0A5Q2N0V2_9FIRM|nr:enoyl-CoA hydratase-related protein [Heliorestis convoluta]QGG47429.1 enoyl-CoA hydratase [Heliorestis convoluta]
MQQTEGIRGKGILQSQSATVLIEQDGPIAWIKINRPAVMNALNYETLLALEDLTRQIRFHRQVQLVVITGVGDKAFSTGADLKERATFSPTQVQQYIYTIRELMNQIETLPQPVIALLNGMALGGGTELALACDLRIAAEGSQMGLTETKLAIIPGAGGTQRLSRLIGAARAKELIFTARTISAQEAYNLGLVNRVVPGHELHQALYELAETILSNGPVALQQAKYAINFGMEAELRTGLALETKSYEVCIPTEDRREALQAFREKRKPQFQGR